MSEGMAHADTFERVEALGLKLPHVEASTKYDGSPVLKLAGCFMAGLAMHATAEPGTLVVRSAPGDRELLLEDAPETYYVTRLLSTPAGGAGAPRVHRPGRPVGSSCPRPGASPSPRHDRLFSVGLARTGFTTPPAFGRRRIPPGRRCSSLT